MTGLPSKSISGTGVAILRGMNANPATLAGAAGPYAQEEPMGSMDFRTEQRQTQTLSPRLQPAVRLLQLSSLEFAQQVHDALGKNPFLEEDGSDDANEDNLS